MLSREVREAQTAVELPAREMMSWFTVNWANVGVYQSNVNLQGGLLNVQTGQVNGSSVVVIQH